MRQCFLFCLLKGLDAVGFLIKHGKGYHVTLASGCCQGNDSSCKIESPEGSPWIAGMHISCFCQVAGSQSVNVITMERWNIPRDEAVEFRGGLYLTFCFFPLNALAHQSRT
jgi:hypothetical protein